jgi:hypothetical protein
MAGSCLVRNEALQALHSSPIWDKKHTRVQSMGSDKRKKKKKKTDPATKVMTQTKIHA